MNITKKQLEEINSSFIGYKSGTVKTKPCRIKFLGNFITTASKKTVWRNKGFAKSALLNHFQYNYNICEIVKEVFNEPHTGYYDCKDLIRELERQNFIEYVEVDLDEFATQKQ